MKLLKNIFLFASLTVSAVSSFAQTPSTTSADASAQTATRTAVFRAGTVYSAELSSVKPDFAEESPYDNAMIDQACWVEIIVKLDQGRSISRFDYSLTGAGGPYPCLAVAEQNEPYSVNQSKWIIRKTSPIRYYRMLFPVSANEMSILGTPFDTKLASMTLKLNYFNSVLPPVTLKIRALGDQKFSSISRIPVEGLYGLTERQLVESK